MTRTLYLSIINATSIFVLILCGMSVSYGQNIKVELVSGEATNYKKGTTVTSKVLSNDRIAPTDRLYLGDNAILVVSDPTNKLLVVKKKGYYTGKDLSDKASKTSESECFRYLAYIIKEIKNYEAAIKFSGNKTTNLQNYGNDFLATLPDTLRMFSYDQLKVNWMLGKNTEMVNVLMVNDKKNSILDIDVTGNQFSFNNITSYFLINKSLNLLIYERQKNGNKILIANTVILPSNLDEAKTKKEFVIEFKELDDIRLNQICQAVKWEINHYSLKALEIYKILLLDFPNDPIVKTSLAAFTKRTGLE